MSDRPHIDNPVFSDPELASEFKRLKYQPQKPQAQGENVPEYKTAKHELLGQYETKFNELLARTLPRRDPKQTDESFLSQLRVNVADSMRELIKSQRDALTGLPNRQFLETTLDRSMKFIDRVGGRVGLLVFDFDNFKVGVNDRFGHDQGDVLIKIFAHILDKVKRSYDTAGRFQGDEFGLILIDADEEAYASIAERIKSEIEQYNSVPGVSAIAVSIGMAEYNQGNSDTVASFLKRADTAMYNAKLISGQRVKLVPWKPGMVLPELPPKR